MKGTEEMMVATDNGLTIEQQQTLSESLAVIISERSAMIPQYEEIIRMDIESDETAKKAKELRSLLVKNRTQGINVWHKTTKDYHLKASQFIDAIKRKEIAVNERMEESLEQIEKYKEFKKKKEEKELHDSRLADLGDLINHMPVMSGSLGAITHDEYQTLKKALTSIQKQTEKEQADKEEQARIDKQKWEDSERERIKADLLRDEQKKKELAAAAEQKKSDLEKKKLEKAPMSKQLNVWIDTFTFDKSAIPSDPITMEIIGKFESFKKWARGQVENI